MKYTIVELQKASFEQMNIWAERPADPSLLEGELLDEWRGDYALSRTQLSAGCERLGIPISSSCGIAFDGTLAPQEVFEQIAGTTFKTAMEVSYNGKSYLVLSLELAPRGSPLSRDDASGDERLACALTKSWIPREGDAIPPDAEILYLALVDADLIDRPDLG